MLLLPPVLVAHQGQPPAPLADKERVLPAVAPILANGSLDNWISSSQCMVLISKKKELLFNDLRRSILTDVDLER